MANIQVTGIEIAGNVVSNPMSQHYLTGKSQPAISVFCSFEPVPAFSVRSSINGLIEVLNELSGQGRKWFRIAAGHWEIFLSHGLRLWLAVSVVSQSHILTLRLPNV
jgi:hypothetical protein